MREMILGLAVALAGCQGLPTSKPIPMTVHWWTGDSEYHEVAANPRTPLEDVNHSLIVTPAGVNLH